MASEICSALLALVCCSAIAGGFSGGSLPGRNLALHRPYTLEPAPSYALCSDDGDRTQLTDGLYTEGYFWTQKSTVGWQNAKPVRITLDLGSDLPIAGVSFSTAAGVAGVQWPAAIDLYVSDDARAWWPAGDLVQLSAKHGAPPAEGYAVHRFWTNELQTHGRYVCLQIVPNGAFTFCDEIEVTEGPAELIHAPRPGKPVSDLQRQYLVHTTSEGVRRAVLADARAIHTQVEAAKLSDRERAELLQRLEAAMAEAGSLRFDPAARAVLPYCPAHARILRIRAAVWRARGVRLTAWQTCAWDPLQPDDLPGPQAEHPALDLLLLRKEVRSAALNVTNPTDHDLTIRVTPHALPGGSNPAWLTVHEVAWTATATGAPVASALPVAERTRGGWLVHVPSGITRQIWLSVDSSSLAPGTYRGALRLAGDDGPIAEAPFRIRVSRIAMPDHLALSLGGWDYTQSPTYGVTARNLPAVVAFLKRYHVDAPWAQSSVMPFGAHDASGRMTAPPDTRPMDAWLERWRGSRFYFVFANLGGPPPETPQARRRIAEWITFWARHIAQRGVRPAQLGLLILDEPREPEHDRIIAATARAIHEAQPEVQVFEDPIWIDPRRASAEMLATSNILCPNRPMWISNRPRYEAVYLPLQAAGHRLAFYSCSGPVRTLDPYSYHRLQAWDCFRYHMVHEGFWAFGDTGGGSSWNRFAAPGPDYAPEFLDDDGPVTSKHMEAIREGLYDHQTLTLLELALRAAERTGKRGPALDAARRVLTEGPRAVTEAKDVGNLNWTGDKDRSLADKVRAQAILALERLAR